MYTDFGRYMQIGQRKHLKSSRWAPLLRCSGLFVLMCYFGAPAPCETLIWLPEDTSPPNYFSGANSRVRAYGCVWNGTLGLTHVRLWIGEGPPLVDYEVPWHPFLYVNEVQIRIMFDSAHFDDGDVVEVTFELTDTDNVVHQESISIPVYNKASLFGRFDLDCQPLFWKEATGQWSTGGDECFGVPVAEDYFAPYGNLNYRNHHRNTMLGWDKVDLLQALSDVNVFYVHTHGSQTHFWTDKNDYHFSYPNPPAISPENAFAVTVPLNYQQTGFTLKPTRIAANGTGLPPFNSTGLPPINVAFLDACDAGTDNSFAEALLYPGGNFYTGYLWFPENQAEVGYAISFQAGQTADCNEAFWGTLADGYTVHEARLEVYEAYDGSNKPANPVDLMHVWGDFYTRLSGVYTGSAYPSPQTTWWRFE